MHTKLPFSGPLRQNILKNKLSRLRTIYSSACFTFRQVLENTSIRQNLTGSVNKHR